MTMTPNIVAFAINLFIFLLAQKWAKIKFLKFTNVVPNSLLRYYWY